MNASEPTVARIYLREQSEDEVIIQLPQSHYQMHLKCDQPNLTVGKRMNGRIVCEVWKVDFVSAGGAYIEPVIGRPRRVQGHVVAQLTAQNAIVVQVVGCAIVGKLPPRWQAADIEPGTKVGLDVYDGSRFEPVTQTAESAV